MIPLFLLFVCALLINNKSIVLAVGFIIGIVIDIINFSPLGKTSAILVLIMLVNFLYQQKFKTSNLFFQFASFACSGFIYLVLSGEGNLYQLFWLTIFYTTIRAIHDYLMQNAKIKM